MKIIVTIAALCMVIVVVVGILWYITARNTAVSTVSRKVSIKITKGTSSWEAARQLQTVGIIHSPLAFVISVRLGGKTVKADTFELDPSRPLYLIVEDVTSSDTIDANITFPEGWRVEQVAQRLLDKHIIETLDEFLAIASEHEGYLFPDTYRFEMGTPARVIVDRMLENFQNRTNDLHVSRDDLIIASIVEREAKHDEDRLKMAGVFKNRLTKNMPLEADPTVQHSIDTSQFKQLTTAEKVTYQFWKPITSEQAKTFESKYNTYRNVGLPPGPISNPGLKSIKAAIEPEQHDYYYFFNLNDGTTIYSKTIDEHNANKRKYGFGGGEN